MKICGRCHKNKKLNEFYKRKRYKDGLSYICKECANKEHKKYVITHNKELRKYRNEYRQSNLKHFNDLQNKRRKNFPWFYILNDIKQRCNNPKNSGYKYYGKRGIKCLLTLKKLKELWFRDKAYEMKRPSIHRINSDGNYKFSNCQFIEMSLHVKISANEKKKPILQYTLNEKFIKEWDSGEEACKNLNLSHASIWDVLNGKRNHCGGFKWKYKLINKRRR